MDKTRMQQYYVTDAGDVQQACALSADESPQYQIPA